MPRSGRRAPFALALAVLTAVAVVAVACGNDGDDIAATSTTRSAPSPRTSTTTEARPTTTSPPPASVPTTATPPPPTPAPAAAAVVRQASSGRAEVALTFDAGSDPGATDRILEILSSRGISASFGLTGRWTAENPGLARRIVAAGHSVINHTQDHPSFTGYSTGTAPLSTEQRVGQLHQAERTIRTITGVDPRPWFRPPYGDYDTGVLADAAAAGYGYVVLWSVDSLGWKGLPAADVAARVLDAAAPGAIVLLHVGAQSTDIDALPTILDGLGARGLATVTIADLLR